MELERFRKATALFDAANSEDPHRVSDGGQDYPKELLYAMRMSEMLARVYADASEALQLAVRAQHIQRWKIPRRDYPMTPQGYQHWRTTLYRFHADRAGELMAEAGYDEAAIEAVRAIVGKRGIKVNAETQRMEDVADLVFLEHYMADFVAQHPDYDEAKWCDILRKTWKKMSEVGHRAALTQIKLPEHLVPVVMKAVAA